MPRLVTQLRYRIFSFITTLLFLSACIEYSPYEIRLNDNESDLNNISITRIESMPVTDTVKFIFAGDAQRFYDQAYLLVESINRLPEIQFVVFGGDVTDFGMLREFQGMHSIISKLNVPYVMVLGNHDLIYSGEEIYRQMYGDFDFSFTLSGIKFICINTNSREFGNNGNVPDISLLERELQPSYDFEKAVVMCHVPPGNDDFDNGLEHAYSNTLSSAGNVILHLNSHNHNFDSNYPYDGSIHFLNSVELKQRKYLYIKVWNGEDSRSSHSFELIEF